MYFLGGKSVLSKQCSICAPGPVGQKYSWGAAASSKARSLVTPVVNSRSSTSNTSLRPVPGARPSNGITCDTELSAAIDAAKLGLGHLPYWVSDLGHSGLCPCEEGTPSCRVSHGREAEPRVRSSPRRGAYGTRCILLDNEWAVHSKSSSVSLSRMINLVLQPEPKIYLAHHREAPD